MNFSVRVFLVTVPQAHCDLESLTALDDPVRGRLYRLVSGRTEPIGRDEAAEEAGIGRALAAYHLDKLVESGLLTATYRRPSGRSGPGAGRPAKFYATSAREFAVTVPPREYELAARLLARAIESDASGHSRAALHDAAFQLGTELGTRLWRGEPGADVAQRALDEILTVHGYLPERAADGVTRLRNCPFHLLAERHKEVVCGMNLALIDGVTRGLHADMLQPALDPQPGYCCVIVRSTSRATRRTNLP
jgi:predicted ArsR family transcriptional regulator